MSITTPSAPILDELSAQLTAATATRDALARRDDEIFRATSPYRVDEGPLALSRADRLRLLADEPVVRRDLTLAQAAVVELQQRVRDAREADRQRRREAFLKQKRPLVAQLDRALAAAATINSKLADLEAAESAAIGGGVEELAWHELRSDADARLSCWRRHARAHGALD